MKKLMIAAAFVCAAAVTQAASISWTLDSIYAPGADGKGWGTELASGDGYVTQLIVGTGVSEGVITGVIADWVDPEIGTLDGGYSENFFDSEELMKADTDYYAQVIITKGDSTLTSAIGTINAASFNDSVAEPMFSTDPSSVANIENFTATSKGIFAESGWTSSATPEPTSGLLLLLGVAGLALKRKRA